MIETSVLRDRNMLQRLMSCTCCQRRPRATASTDHSQFHLSPVRKRRMARLKLAMKQITEAMSTAIETPMAPCGMASDMEPQVSQNRCEGQILVQRLDP